MVASLLYVVPQISSFHRMNHQITSTTHIGTYNIWNISMFYTLKSLSTMSIFQSSVGFKKIYFSGKTWWLDSCRTQKEEIKQFFDQTLCRIISHRSYIHEVLWKCRLYVWKVFLVYWDLTPETVWASMSTGFEQILVRCFLLKSLKSSESPSLETSPSSNQAVVQAAEREVQP